LIAIILASQPARAQNVVIVSFDDLGIDGVDTYGFVNSGPTPNIDALADEGVLFRNAWANRMCSVSRAQMLTGSHPTANGIGTNTSTKFNDVNRNQGLNPSLPNIANVLQGNGYRTAVLGKWHLGGYGALPEILAHPNDVGFDYYAGRRNTGMFPEIAHDYFEWEKCINGICSVSNIYRTTDTVDEAIAWIGNGDPEAFFAYVAFNAPHTPCHVPPQNLHSFGAFDDSSLSPTCHKAMVEAADTELARLLATINWATTTVIFLGDNGTPGDAMQWPFDPTKGKGTNYGGGIHVPLIIKGEAVSLSAEGQESEALIGVIDIFATIMEIANINEGTPYSESIVPYVIDPSTASIKETLYAESFVPNGGPPRDDSYYRVARNERYVLHKHGFDPPEFYDLDVDAFEQTQLDTTNLNPQEIAAFGELAPLVGITPVPEPGVVGSTLAIASVLALMKRQRNKQKLEL
ncbi:MAG: arylsulfatase A-like enzyme, partial [Myxococcota bacterium]